MTDDEVDIGILGGTGIYDLIEEIEEKKVYTPFGRPSDVVQVGQIKGRNIAFIPRHGKNHTIPPHNINYRANLWALKSFGVTRVISPSAVGSLKENFKPGEFVFNDQFIDRTKNRKDTFYEGGQVCHISSADPFCSELRSFFIKSATDLGLSFHRKGTYVCIEGPRFSTRAESKLFRSWDADVIGMTIYPECILAKELEMCYISVAMVTDYDVWTEKPVSVEEVIQTMKKNSEGIKKIITNTIPKISKKRNCKCKQSLKEALI